MGGSGTGLDSRVVRGFLTGEAVSSPLPTACVLIAMVVEGGGSGLFKDSSEVADMMVVDEVVATQGSGATRVVILLAFELKQQEGPWL